MALIKCHECGNQVSTEAEACPGCGAKPKNSASIFPKKISQAQSVGVVLFLAFVFWLLIPSDKEKAIAPVKQEVVANQAPAGEVKSESIPIQQTESPKPEHFYSVKDGNSYGYESALSQNDINNGVASKPLIMFSLVSKKDNKLVLKSETGGASNIISCDLPCDHVKVVTIAGGFTSQPETLLVTKDSVIGYAIFDAVNGFMDAK